MVFLNMIIERGIKINRLSELQPVLEQWQNLNDDLTWFEYDDAPWWYNERASLSIFAGAIWKSGGSVFEEFSSIKENVTKQTYSGRCDIEFSVGRSEFIGEAKQCWIDLNENLQKNIRDVESSINDAVSDARQAPVWENHSRVGIVFVVPSISKKKKENIDIHLRSFIELVTKIEDVTVAWVFPRKARYLEPPKDNPEAGSFFPGVLIVLVETISSI